MIDEKWFPYVSIPIDSKVTNVVGANESGKSHLLSAIEKGISGQGIERQDFCRYSQYFTLQKGKIRFPDFGFEWGDLSDEDIQSVKVAGKIPEEIEFESFYLFRNNRKHLNIYIPEGNSYEVYKVDENSITTLTNILPRVFRMNSDVTLPKSVEIRALANGSIKNNKSKLENLNRAQRFGFFDSWFNIRNHFRDRTTVTKAATQISSAFSPYITESSQESSKENKQIELARRLIVDVAKIDPEYLSELYDAIRDEEEGHANAIIQKINESLKSCLNFSQWWAQDKDFQLVVYSREYELIFTIKDRTGTEYSFDERSSGLKYFLSYYIQDISHQPSSDVLEILLMDEPDAYLSSQAQQDLLKIFEAFANPKDNRLPIQVIYVTHSPFLINKNYAERIRVLEKGALDEGTRVVKNVARNHYEPLRSAFGAMVSETTFIGNCNLFVEGVTDQILIAGAATYLQTLDISNLERLDLNCLTIVPAGGASHIPYLVYLARGRDVDMPAVIVLLDSDKSGDDAKRGIQKGGVRKKRLLKDEYIFQIGELADGNDVSTPRNALVEIEDLIPINTCLEAIKMYLIEICEAEDAIIKKLTATALKKHFENSKDFFDAVDSCINEISQEQYHVDQIGFARNVIQIVKDASVGQVSKSKNKLDLEEFARNFKLLFRQINSMQRSAERELAESSISQIIKRKKNAFLRDNPHEAKKEDAYVFLNDLESILDDSYESDCTKVKINMLRRDYELNTDFNQLIKDYAQFKEEVNNIAYEGLYQSQERK